MEKIRCNDVIQLKFDEFEKHGRQLIYMVARLAECRKRCCDPKVSLDLLSDIQKKLYDRFKVEEAYMKRTGDPDLETHREQHHLFKKNLAFCWFEMMEKNSQISIEFCDYLMEWLNFHIQNLDSKLKKPIR